MERRLLLAIGLMVGLLVLSNVVFPPLRPLATDDPGADSVGAVAAESAGAIAGEPFAPGALDSQRATRGDAEAGRSIEPDPAAADRAANELAPASEAEPTVAARIVAVRSDLYEYRFDTQGARLVGATLLDYPNFEPDRAQDGPVELLRSQDWMLGYRIATGSDTVGLVALVFDAAPGDVDVAPEGTELRFSAPVGSAGVTFDVTYRFSPTNYTIAIEGGLRNVGDQGYTLVIDLGRGLHSNEANPREDFGQMAVVTRTRTGNIASEKLGRLELGEAEFVSGGPFSWVASKSKYFLTALVSEEGGSGFGGVLLEGVPEDAGEGDASQMSVALPVPGGSFRLLAYLGPQDFERLKAIGQELQSVNPFGWKFLQWFIRPFGGLVIDFLTWMHHAFNLAYGWVLILFGIIARIVLFPLYQMSMRSQMKQMSLQPEIKRIQEKYKEDPPKLQQEMMKAYKEGGASPLGGCLPMLLPFPILITLFFVFQNTIEFRGVPFLWLPDLSLADPLYIVPLLMGTSMLLLNWIGQRGMETNQQMKMFTYVLPVVFTFMFARFAAGLNLYYAASNIASLPQQLYLSKERRAHQAKSKPGSGSDDKADAKVATGTRKPKQTATGGKRGKPKQTPAGGKRGKPKSGR